MPGSRKIKNESDHRFTMRTDNGCVIRLLPGGKRSYLWVGDPDDKFLLTVSGAKVLRDFAKAILAEVPE